MTPPTNSVGANPDKRHRDFGFKQGVRLLLLFGVAWLSLLGGIMRYKYPVTVVGCIAHAAGIAALFPYLAENFAGIFWLLLILWPFWLVALWRFSQGTKIPVRIVAAIAPMIFGVYLLRGALSLLAFAGGHP